jgi:branched-chain amino acid transport system permease protein
VALFLDPTQGQSEASVSIELLIEQLFNGLGYGLMLFLLAAGLTLVFGVMDTMNLAHGSLFMLGAYVAATVHQRSGSFVLAVVGAAACVAAFALLLERTLMRRLYSASHLTQVVGTVGVIYVLEDLVKRIWGTAPVMASAPASLTGAVHLAGDWSYPAYRFVIVAAGLLTAAALYVLVNRTRLGMLVRAGASNRPMAEAMGVRVDVVFTSVFVIGAVLAGLGGALMGPVTAVQAGMGEAILIPALVVIVIGGIGSVRGAFAAALLIGLVDTAGRAFLPMLLKQALPPAVGAEIGRALAGMLMYLLMAAVLAFKPNGLFPARG